MDVTKREAEGNMESSFKNYVWLNLTQKQLDQAYDPSAWAPNMDVIIGRCEINSEIARHRIGRPVRGVYGETKNQALDLYRTSSIGSPIHIFIHGGAWKGCFASQWGFLAENFVKHGVHFIAPDFVNALQTGGDLAPLVDQVRCAIAWTYKNASSFGGDPERIYLSGHSSGAHLAAMALVTDWSHQYGLPDNFLKGAVLVSGIYDLRPVRISYRSEYLHINDEDEEMFSPQRQLSRLNTPIAIVNGMLEGPEFIRQSHDFANLINALGKPVQLIQGQKYNHFEILETLASPFGLAGLAALKQIFPNFQSSIR